MLSSLLKTPQFSSIVQTSGVDLYYNENNSRRFLSDRNYFGYNFYYNEDKNDLNQLSSCDDKLYSTVRLQLTEIERTSDSDS